MLSTSDRLLVRWSAGHVQRGAPGSEQYLELRGVTSKREAERIADELLAAFHTQRGTDAVTGHVHSGTQQPMGGFKLGDTLDGQRVVSISITGDAESDTLVTPELADPLKLVLEQFERKIARLNAGVTSEYASPFPPEARRGDRIDTTPPEFKWSWGDTAPPSTPSTPTPVTLGALGYWPLRANFADASGNGNDLTITTGTSTDFTDGWWQSDGGTTLNPGLSLSLGAWTIAATAPIQTYLASYSGAPIVTTTSSSGDSDPGLFVSEGHPYIVPRHYLSGNGAYAETSIDESTPQRLAITFDGTTTNLYIGGILVGSGTGGSALSGDITVGGSGAHGRLGEVSLYDYALTQSQIASL